MVRNKSSPAKSMNVGQSGGAGKAMRGANAMYGNLVAEVATEVDLICVCKPQERIKAAFYVPRPHELHANIECPFRRLNKVQTW